MAAEDYIDTFVAAAIGSHDFLSPTAEDFGLDPIDWERAPRRHYASKKEYMAVVKKVTPAPTKKLLKKSKAEEETKSDITVWGPPIVPATHIQDYLMLLFGEKKIGKTTLASMFPDSVFMFTEPNKALAVRAVRVDNVPLITTWKDMRRATKALKANAHARTIVVDVVDLAFKMCWNYVCKKLVIDHPADEAWGKGWASIRDEFDFWIQDLIATGKGIILISHDIEREVKTRGGESYHKLVPSVANQAREAIESIVDIWAYFGYDGDRRMLQIRGNDHVAAGHRLQKNFRTPSGDEVLTIDMTNDPEQGFQNFNDAFNNRYVPRMVQPREESERPTAVKKKVKLKKRTA